MKITKLLLLASIASLFIISACKKDSDNTLTSASLIVPNDFLSAGKYDKLVIQIQAVSGYELSDATTTNLVNFLQQRINKPVGIQVLKSSIASPGKSIYTVDDLKTVEKNNRTEYPTGTTLTAYIFVADAPYTEDNANAKVLGVTYSATSIALFEHTIKSFTGGFNQPSLAVLESTVSEHEFGHVLGLVNNGTNMVVAHQDVANGKHCSNSNCLMYYNVESSASITNIFGSGIPSLDSSCISDLKANGGK